VSNFTQSGASFDVPRGKYIGKPLGAPLESERAHFIKCPACGGWIDCRDLGQVFEHEGPLRGRIFCGKPEVHFSGECSNRDYSRSLRKRMRRGAMKPE